MATPQPSASRRPKLTLSIKTSSPSPSPRAPRTMSAANPSSPTAFNTLSNVYVTAIERSTPVTAINTHNPLPPRLQLTTDFSKDARTKLHTPYNISYPETPLSANPASPIHMELAFPTILTSTPPLSAGPTDVDEPKKFSFIGTDGKVLPMPSHHTQPEPRTPRRRTQPSLTVPGSTPPYTHPRSLHSILRNSPLPPRTSTTPTSPRRQSLRLQERAARRVAYNSPIEQTITTSWRLGDEASPLSPAVNINDTEAGLGPAITFTDEETRDGGQTPGPFEDMRRRMAGLAASSPLSPTGSGGIRKNKKRKEKKRRWVWTIGKEEGEEDSEEVGGAVAAVRAARAKAASEPPPLLIVPPSQTPTEDLPTPSVESFDENLDVPMLESSDIAEVERGLTPGEMEVDAVTPTSSGKAGDEDGAARSDRLGSEGLFNEETGSRRDTPVPPDMMVT